jgi:hypothetical protein
MKPKKPLLFAFGLAVAAALVSIATLPAAAQDRDHDRDHLKGTYFSTTESLCLVSQSGFNPNQTPIPPTDGNPPAYAQSFRITGDFEIPRRWQRNGQFKELTIVHPPGSASVTSDEVSFLFTYTLADDGTLTIESVPGSVSGTLLTGPLAGHTFTVDIVASLSGRIARNGIAMLTSTDPVVETLMISGLPPRPRICHRTRVLTPVHVHEYDRDSH